MTTTPTRSEIRAELERRAARRDQRIVGPHDLMAWIPWAGGRVGQPYQRPVHLRPLVDILSSTLTSEVRAVVSIPPRHAKTTTLLAWCVQALLRDPTLTISYVSYADDFAATKCMEAKRLARAVGLDLAGRDREDYWETSAGGLFRSAGIRGQHAGAGYRVILIDDAHKNREEAESPTTREKVITAFSSDLQTRRDPRGTSIICAGARWHQEDLPGWIVENLGWPYVTMPALGPEGEALWPSVWPSSKLQDVRRGMSSYEWQSLYQCDPHPRGTALFGEPTYCSREDIPRTGKHFVGFDLAYSGKTHSDWSVMIVLVKGPGDVLYVADMLRVQAPATQFAAAAKERLVQWGNPAGLWHTSGPEKGTADFMRQMGIRLIVKTASQDKFVRSQPAAAKWQAGSLRVPRDAPWTADLVSEVCRFTGLGGGHDDQVDALASAVEQSHTGISFL